MPVVHCCAKYHRLLQQQQQQHTCHHPVKRLHLRLAVFDYATPRDFGVNRVPLRISLIPASFLFFLFFFRSSRCSDLYQARSPLFVFGFFFLHHLRI